MSRQKSSSYILPRFFTSRHLNSCLLYYSVMGSPRLLATPSKSEATIYPLLSASYFLNTFFKSALVQFLAGLLAITLTKASKVSPPSPSSSHSAIKLQTVSLLAQKLALKSACLMSLGFSTPILLESWWSNAYFISMMSDSVSSRVMYRLGLKLQADCLGRDSLAGFRELVIACGTYYSAQKGFLYFLTTSVWVFEYYLLLILNITTVYSQMYNKLITHSQCGMDDISGANIQLQLRYKMNPTVLSFMGHLQGRTHTALSQDNKKLITLGCDDLIFVWNTDDMTSRSEIEVSNKIQERFTCIEYVQRLGVFILGTESGQVYSLMENNTSNSTLLYKCATPAPGGIRNLKLGASQRYLAIGSGEEKGVVSDLEKSRFYKTDASHEGIVTFAGLCCQDRVLITWGSDGYTYVYAHQPESINPLQFCHKYQMCHSPSIMESINFSQNPTNLYHVSFAGATTLQQLHFSPSATQSTQLECTYKIKVQIHEQSQIIFTHWLNETIIVLGLASKVSLWNYVTGTKFHVLNGTGLREMQCGSGRFYGVDEAGMVYRYQNSKSIEFQNEEARKYKLKIANQVNNVSMNNTINMETEQQNKMIEQKAPKVQPEYSKSVHLVTKPPQTAIESFYPAHVDFQFLFYNQHGCIVKHTSEEEEQVQLQFHDKFRLRKIKFEGRGKYYYYALNEKCFMYSSLTHVYFQMECAVKTATGSKETSLVKWDYKAGDVEGVAIGNTWAAVACKDCVHLLDLFGNQFGIFCHDRMFLAMAAYQDMLALAYCAAIPLTQCQIFELKLYRITNQSIKLQRLTKMPIKVQHELKWFGFSQEGALFSQDTSESVRMYCWDNNQWVSVYQEDGTKYKLYIQHIENYEIYGFRIEQKEGEPVGPTVLPRSLPRKILLEFNEQKVGYLTDEENKRLQNIYARRLRIRHEIFRNRRWFKYRYSRQEDNPLFRLSQKISSEEDIEQMKVQLDMHVIEQVRKIMPSLESRPPQTELPNVKYQLLNLSHSLLFYQESLSKAVSLIGLGNCFECYWDSEPVEKQVKSKRYDQLGRLGALVDRGWIQRTVE